MGCGTGILAILAEKMGASILDAIDNDENAFENTRENVQNNKCSLINVRLGGAEQIIKSYDCIIANINKNILMADMHSYCSHLIHNGSIVFSGFYSDDLRDIESNANGYGLSLSHVLEKNRWVAAKFDKN
jgi:ribosomal protein L11 methyltransferase